MPLGRVDRPRHLRRAALMDVREHMCVAVRHHGRLRLPGPDFLAADDERDVRPLAGKFAKFLLQGSPLRRSRQKTQHRLIDDGRGLKDCVRIHLVILRSGSVIFRYRMNTPFPRRGPPLTAIRAPHHRRYGLVACRDRINTEDTETTEIAERNFSSPSSLSVVSVRSAVSVLIRLSAWGQLNWRMRVLMSQ